MVEFKGYLTGEAEKRFVRKSRHIAFMILGIAVALVIPFVLFIGFFVLRDVNFIYIMLAGIAVIPLLVFIPKRKKEHLAMLPQRIYTDEEHIVCEAARYKDVKFISDVSKVIDREDYYELCFPFSKMSEKFICQKSLLTRGTFQEFERLFKGKIIK